MFLRNILREQRKGNNAPCRICHLPQHTLRYIDSLIQRRHFSSSPFETGNFELDSPNLGALLPHQPLLYPSLKAQVNELWLARIIGPLISLIF
ncbi:hypothetical protein AVEN_207975-1 [Araneus ventricosus]|uniref:Uncharacterized protein n=1 Tax=Araneus ventricosus TaxID=182803 RepID=A0A4Y2SZK0_ARAVE|nr:hypothetical protein AVEN_207975-1 [Araneus ventricosus]